MTRKRTSPRKPTRILPLSVLLVINAMYASRKPESLGECYRFETPTVFFLSDVDSLVELTKLIDLVTNSTER